MPRWNFDQPRQSLESYEPAFAAAKELGDENAEARLSDALAQVLFRLGRIEETRALMERALELHRSCGGRRRCTRADPPLRVQSKEWHVRCRRSGGGRP